MASLNFAQDSRAVRHLMRARLDHLDDGRLALRAPAVGLWRGRPPVGTLIRPDGPLGHIEILGELHELVAPAGAHGVVAAGGDGSGLARRPVAYDDLLLILDRQAAEVAETISGVQASDEPGHGLILRAPSSGRFYARPAPGKPAFVSVGEAISEGKVVGLLEVMKTFTRIHYGGGDLPANARVTVIYAEDEADVAAGDPLLAVERGDG
ncbi:MAG: hypothetical protein H6710_22700 [Myxococcales bacterium]|nr:hypothetical protein [Myxococcales bacterium]